MTSTRLPWENVFSLIDPQINAEGVHTWPFDPACPVDVLFFQYDKRHHIRMNRHDYFELFYLHQGELTCHVQDHASPMCEGDLAIINSTQYHTMQLPAQGSTRRPKAVTLYFKPELIRAADAKGEDAEYLAPFLMQDASSDHLITHRADLTEEIFDLIKRIHLELPATTGRARLAVKTYLKMILLLLVNHYAERRGTMEMFNRRQRAIEQLQPLFDYLETHYQQPISIESAAAVVQTSPSHFMRLFKQVTGQPFVMYLTHFRIAKAQMLLATTDLSVAEVGQEAGFCDQSYFGLTFRKLVHLTPLQYKRQYGSVKIFHPDEHNWGKKNGG
jgi:AraC family transcriptional activator of pobA